MTATELYEIVKDHRDVWGGTLAYTQLGEKFLDRRCEIAFPDDSSEAALLGLGVKWLADTTTEFHGECHDCMYLVPARKLTVPQSSFLAAVYAAVAEVKRAQAAKG